MLPVVLLCLAPLVPDVRTVTTKESREWLRSHTQPEWWGLLGDPENLTVSRTLTASNASVAWLAVTNGLKAAGSPTNRLVDFTAATNIYEDIVFGVQNLDPAGISGAEPTFSSGRNGNQSALVLNTAGGNDVFAVNAQMAHAWLPSVIYPHLHIQPQTTNAMTNVWKVSYAAADINAEFPAETVVTNTITLAGNAQWVHRLVDLPAGGINLSNAAGPSTIVRLRYELLSTTADVHLVSYDVHYRVGGSPVTYNP